MKRPRSPTRNGEKFSRAGRAGSPSDSDHKAFKEQIRRKGKGIKGAHDSDSEDSEFPAVALNLHRAGFSMHRRRCVWGGLGGPGRRHAPELLMLLNAAEELEMTENPHANVFRGQEEGCRDVIARGTAPGLNGANNPWRAADAVAAAAAAAAAGQQQHQQQQAMIGGIAAPWAG